MASLVERYGWDGMAQRINVNCFKSDPSIKSSLKFLRKPHGLEERLRVCTCQHLKNQKQKGTEGLKIDHFSMAAFGRKCSVEENKRKSVVADIFNA